MKRIIATKKAINHKNLVPSKARNALRALLGTAVKIRNLFQKDLCFYYWQKQ